MKEYEWLWQALRQGQHDLVTALAPREFEPWRRYLIFSRIFYSLFGERHCVTLYVYIYVTWCSNLYSKAEAQWLSLQKKAPDEDWKSCHPWYGTPLMAAVHNAIVCPGGKQLGKDIRSVAVAVCQLVASAQIFIRPN